MQVERRLGVNIDHVATLRQARGEQYPSLVDAAQNVLDAGADQITIHLREDRRHIQDFDLPAIKMVTEKFGVPLNLEMGANLEILDLAIQVRPEWICLVPEKREELTTEGGLNLLDEEVFGRVKNIFNICADKLPQTKISCFVESDLKILEKCLELKAHAVEIHTGDFAMAFNRGEDYSHFLENYAKAFEFLKPHKTGFHAGHGLTDKSVLPLVEQKLFAEYNIGHWVISQAIFEGLGPVVKRLRKIIKEG